MKVLFETVPEAENEEGQPEISLFEELLEKETKEARESYEKAKKHYESVFQTFLIKNVTGKKKFERFYERAWYDIADNLYPEVVLSRVAKLDVLDEMVFGYCYWLRDGRYDTEDGVPESEYC